jgi:hypothetical protein
MRSHLVAAGVGAAATALLGVAALALGTGPAGASPTTFTTPGTGQQFQVPAG